MNNINKRNEIINEMKWNKWMYEWMNEIMKSLINEGQQWKRRAEWGKGFKEIKEIREGERKYVRKEGRLLLIDWFYVETITTPAPK